MFLVLQCVDNLDVAFGIGATMFALDFAGSGMSDGEYVTLGEFEKDDVAAVRYVMVLLCFVNGLSFIVHAGDYASA